MVTDCDYGGESCDGHAVHFFECRETGSREQCCDPCLREIRGAEVEAEAKRWATWAEQIGPLFDDESPSPPAPERREP